MTGIELRRASGCLFGLAYGDALGAPTEFLTVDQITERYGPTGPRDLVGDPALITDDTQMTLAVARALLAAQRAVPGSADALAPARVEPLLREQFVVWWSSPDNNRAPGAMCIRDSATSVRSKGCGANMRVAPVGLLSGVDDAHRAGLAQFQSALTHAHPTALAASDLTAFAVTWLRAGMAPFELPAALRARCAEQRRVYHGEWLADLWTRAGAASPEDFIATGWDECVGVLDRLDKALAARDRAADPCLITGEGWIAEEALATGLLCFLLFPYDPVAALTRAATSSGDSDSIACLTGAFAGASLGVGVWPAEWAQRIEHGAELAALGRAWD